MAEPKHSSGPYAEEAFKLADDAAAARESGRRCLHALSPRSRERAGVRMAIADPESVRREGGAEGFHIDPEAASLREAREKLLSVLARKERVVSCLPDDTQKVRGAAECARRRDRSRVQFGFRT